MPPNRRCKIPERNQSSTQLRSARQVRFMVGGLDAVFLQHRDALLRFLRAWGAGDSAEDTHVTAPPSHAVDHCGVSPLAAIDTG